MPKESKKFINPLLRPSQDAETRQGNNTKNTSTKESSGKTSTETLPKTATSTSTVTASERESVVELEEVLPVREEKHQVAPIADKTTENVQSPEKASGNSSAKLSTLTEPTPPYFVEQPAPSASWDTDAATTTSIQPDVRGTVDTLPTASVPPTETSKYSNEEVNVAANNRQSTQTTSPRVSDAEISATYIATLPSTQTSYLSAGSSMVPSSTLTKRTESAELSSLEVVRRKRGSQAFEKTHERITLWIDKRLKQGFEELAYELEQSKTALLNEAIADLLKK